MGESIVTWNVPNFITISLMVLLLAFGFTFVSKALKTQKAS